MGIKFGVNREVADRAERIVHKASQSIILAVGLAACAVVIAVIALVVATR